MVDNVVHVDSFVAYTLGILVFFCGMFVNRRVGFLRNYNIPEPVTGGLVAAFIALGIYLGAGIELSYDLETRDTLLVYFFTSIGLNARVHDLVTGGRPLATLLILTLVFIVVQDVVGVVTATTIGLSPQMGLVAGSASLIGGHGTAIAWAPEFAEAGMENALEIGVAAATLGLVVASLVGGPIAKLLIDRHGLSGTSGDPMMGIAYEDEKTASIKPANVMSVFLVLHISIIVGWIANEGLESIGVKLPLFVSCLMAGIILSNTVPKLFPMLRWPARTPSLALVSDFSLNIFLAMSLMGMQLWAIAELAGPLLILLLLQTVAAIGFILLLLYPLMGRDYQAAVLSAGFGGFALGATPTAIANMTAVTKKHGPAPLAFIILPLVAAFFVDITNAFVLQTALGMMGP